MNARVDQLFDEARMLGPEERSQLALALLDSVEGDAIDEAEVERAWIVEAHKRLEALANGSMIAVSWDEAKTRIASL
jgi:putative addiction module component (TIGR02574 family)